MLAVVCLVDLFADWGARLWGWKELVAVAAALDVVAAALALWMFIDLHKRRPRGEHGDDTGG